MVSKLAISGMAIYLCAFAWAALYAHFDHRTFSGVFAVLLALPWIDYFPNLMPAAVALNALIIYVVLAALSHLPAWIRKSHR